MDRTSETRIVVYGGSGGWTWSEIVVAVVAVLLLLMLVCSCICLALICFQCTRCCCQGIRNGFDLLIASIQRTIALGFIGLLKMVGHGVLNVFIWMLLKVAGATVDVFFSISSRLRRSLGSRSAVKARTSPPTSDSEEGEGETIELDTVHHTSDAVSNSSYHSLEENLEFIDKRYTRVTMADLRASEE